jgi:hypothetical protein
MNENNKRDFELLSKFVEQRLTSGGYIQGYMHSTLQLIQDNLNANKKSKGVNSEIIKSVPHLQGISNINQKEQWTLKFRFHDGITCTVHNISPVITFEHLKLLVKDAYESNVNIEKFTSLDKKNEYIIDKQTISSCGIKNNDILNVESSSRFSNTSSSSPRNLSLSSTQSSKNKSNISTKSNEVTAGNSKVNAPDTSPFSVVSGANRIMNSNVYPETATQALFLLLHSFMIEEGFISITLDARSVPGFAPALRELPKDKFIPDNVFNDDSNMLLLYKHKGKPGKQYTLLLKSDTSGFDDRVILTISQNKGDKHDFTLFISKFIDTNVLLNESKEGLFSGVCNSDRSPYINEMVFIFLL